MKRCSKCQTKKEEAEFSKCASTPDGLYRYCKECDKKKSQAKYLINREAQIEKAKQWKLANPERVKELKAKYKKASKKARPVLAIGDKKCSKCGEVKPVAEFGKCRTFTDGLYCQCNECRRAGGRESYVRNREKIRAKANGNPVILARMRKCGAAYRKSEAYTIRRISKYGLDLSTYKEMLTKQNNRCPICLKEFGSDTPHVDHDHVTGEVRALLCLNCNRGIGLLGDNNGAALRATYLLNRTQIPGDYVI